MKMNHETYIYVLIGHLFYIMKNINIVTSGPWFLDVLGTYFDLFCVLILQKM